jgi:hypothetical protein
MRNYADLVWRRQMEPNRHHCRKTTKRKMKKYKVVPEVWIRRDGVHPWGSGRCWTYANLGDGVDHSTNKLDIVNAADFEDKKQDYMVLVWNEQDVEIPLPLGQRILDFQATYWLLIQNSKRDPKVQYAA